MFSSQAHLRSGLFSVIFILFYGQNSNKIVFLLSFRNSASCDPVKDSPLRALLFFLKLLYSTVLILMRRKKRDTKSVPGNRLIHHFRTMNSCTLLALIHHLLFWYM